jgi:hypothetical protein
MKVQGSFFTLYYHRLIEIVNFDLNFLSAVDILVNNPMNRRLRGTQASSHLWLGRRVFGSDEISHLINHTGSSNIQATLLFAHGFADCWISISIVVIF